MYLALHTAIGFPLKQPLVIMQAFAQTRLLPGDPMQLILDACSSAARKRCPEGRLPQVLALERRCWRTGVEKASAGLPRQRD
jgi:hypothetical protein